MIQVAELPHQCALANARSADDGYAHAELWFERFEGFEGFERFEGFDGFDGFEGFDGFDGFGTWAIEYLLVAAAMRLGEEAYGAAIRQEIEQTTKTSCSIGALCTTIDRLEAKGLLRTWLGDATPHLQWLVERASLLLEPDEREFVRGDLAETGESGQRALVDVLGLIVRRQVALWTDIVMPAMVRLLFVAVPALLGVRRGVERQPVRIETVLLVANALATITMHRMKLIEASASFFGWRPFGPLPNPGFDGRIGTDDDITDGKLRLLPFVVMWPATLERLAGRRR